MIRPKPWSRTQARPIAVVKVSPSWNILVKAVTHCLDYRAIKCALSGCIHQRLVDGRGAQIHICRCFTIGTADQGWLEESATCQL